MSERDETTSLLSMMNQSAGADAIEGMEEELDGQPRPGLSRLLGHGGLTVAAVLVAGVLAIVLLRTLSGQPEPPPDASGVEARIEAALVKLSNPEATAKNDPLKTGNLQALFEDTDRIVSVFVSDHRQRQVPLEYVKKNPFRLSLPEPKVEVTQAAAQKVVDEAKLARERQLAQWQAEFDRLRLQSIMAGDHPVAFVNGELCRPGGSVGSFHVAKISPSSVTLTVGEQTFVLTME